MSSYEQKTKPTDKHPIDYIEELDISKRKRQDAYKLLEIFKYSAGYKPKMWGEAIIGYGSYHYVYKTGHSGEAPLVGFSPKKQRFSLYLTCDQDRKLKLLDELGKHKKGVSCVYVNKLADIDIDVLQQLVKESVEYIKSIHSTN